jgi:aminoglycoside phosphotransferase (APT) family kinase protein
MNRAGNGTSPALGRRLGSGKEAEVFAFGEAVIKLYRAGVPKRAVFREAAALAQAEALGLPVPPVGGVREIDGRWGVVMSRVDGRSFAETIVAQPADKGAYLREMASLHCRIHACQAVFFGSLKARLEADICRAAALSEGQRRRLLEELAGLPDGDRHCHGDFHPWNVLGVPSRPSVIDWMAASRGTPAADVCRSYVLIKSIAPDLASSYVDAYAQVAGERLEDIFKWLSVVAAARLAEGVPDEVNSLMAMVENGRQAGTQ